jgi:hypothetical protein
MQRRLTVVHTALAVERAQHVLVNERRVRARRSDVLLAGANPPRAGADERFARHGSERVDQTCVVRTDARDDEARVEIAKRVAHCVMLLPFVLDRQ